VLLVEKVPRMLHRVQIVVRLAHCNWVRMVSWELLAVIERLIQENVAHIR
jgi:hypothetical protein